ncbi:MAG: hypothetical protein AAF483_06075, partial [Planctomycetota bacterium]
AYDDRLLYVGTGRSFIIFGADDGEEIGRLDEMKSFFGMGDANPLNLIVSDGCCLFQMMGGASPQMTFFGTNSLGHPHAINTKF